MEGPERRPHECLQGAPEAPSSPLRPPPSGVQSLLLTVSHQEVWRRGASCHGIKSRSLRTPRRSQKSTTSPVGLAPSSALPPAPATSPSGPDWNMVGKETRERASSHSRPRFPQESARSVPQRPGCEEISACARPRALSTPPTPPECANLSISCMGGYPALQRTSGTSHLPAAK